MAVCLECGEKYSDKRKALGYTNCLDCGDGIAQKEALRRTKCIAPAFNKGPYQYVATVDQAKDLGK